jgi:hypothetical protein
MISDKTLLHHTGHMDITLITGQMKTHAGETNTHMQMIHVMARVDIWSDRISSPHFFDENDIGNVSEYATNISVPHLKRHTLVTPEAALVSEQCSPPAKYCELIPDSHIPKLVERVKRSRVASQVPRPHTPTLFFFGRPGIHSLCEQIV